MNLPNETLELPHIEDMLSQMEHDVLEILVQEEQGSSQQLARMCDLIRGYQKKAEQETANRNQKNTKEYWWEDCVDYFGKWEL